MPHLLFLRGVGVNLIFQFQHIVHVRCAVGTAVLRISIEVRYPLLLYLGEKQTAVFFFASFWEWNFRWVT
jgi:hypothetical protein